LKIHSGIDEGPIFLSKAREKNAFNMLDIFASEWLPQCFAFLPLKHRFKISNS
jgi:hypothetical protein